MPEALPQFPADYVPQVVEFYDELGLLVRIENLQIVHQIKRPDDYKYEYISGYFDGHLGILVNQKEEVLTRVAKMSVMDNIIELAKDSLGC